MFLRQECKAESRALSVAPLARIESLLRIGKAAVSVGNGVAVHLARIGARRVGPCATHECIGTPGTDDAVVERVVAHALSAAFAAVPLSGVYHAVAYAERAVAVVAAVLYGAAVGVFAVLADYGVGRDVTARCQ